MANLDGTDKLTPTPFDAHEQATRGEHIPTAIDSPDKDPASVQEYPKAVEHTDAGEPVVVNSAEEEAAYKSAKDAEKASA